MKFKKFIMPLALLTLLVFFYVKTSGSSSVYNGSKEVSFSGGSKNVTAVYVNLNDPNISIEAGMANNTVGSAAPLSSIASQFQNSDTEVLAAINGTFFDAYTNTGFYTPYGTVISEGKLLTSNNAPTVAYTESGKLLIGTAYPAIKGTSTHEGKEHWKTDWSAYSVNKVTNSNVDTDFFTSEFGATTKPHNRTSIVVRNGIIVDKIKGEAPIHKDGFTIITGSEWLINDVFQIGDTVTYDVIAVDSSNQPLGEEWQHIKSAVGVGPTLLKNGVIVLDAVGEGFTEGKIATGAGQRSFAGYIASTNTMVIGTIPNVTLSQMAEMLKNMGITDAINLDGGASSGLYYNGSYLTTPGRNLSNALVVTNNKGAKASGTSAPETSSSDTQVLNEQETDLTNKNIIIMEIGKSTMLVNNESLQIDPGRDTSPIIINGRTMVPVSAIVDSIGGQSSWDNDSKKITISKSGKTIQLWINKKNASVNGVSQILYTPPQIINDRTMVPVSFITEQLGCQVQWKPAEKQIIIGFD